MARCMAQQCMQCSWWAQCIGQHQEFLSQRFLVGCMQFLKVLLFLQLGLDQLLWGAAFVMGLQNKGENVGQLCRAHRSSLRCISQVPLLFIIHLKNMSHLFMAVDLAVLRAGPSEHGLAVEQGPAVHGSADHAWLVASSN